MNQDLLPPRLVKLLKEEGLFEGKYRLKRLLGVGGFATVIHAEHEAMGREVALKFLRPDMLKAHPEVGKRFLMEVKLASRLTNPHTVMIFDFGETEEGVPFMVLEYVKGRTLDRAIEKYGGLGLKRSLEIILQILESLEEAHSKNIIHRDLKPANIMVGKGGPHQKLHVKVLDFGVAKLVEDAEKKLKTKSGRQSTQFIGTPRYMSPEQILGQKVSPASDLYSLGLILYEICAGEGSIETNNVAKVAQLHLDAAPLPLRRMEDLPAPIQHLITTATSRKVEDRYKSAREFREAVEAAIAEGSARNIRAKTANPAALEDEKAERAERKRTSDVFAGRAYVAPPEESEASMVEAVGAAAVRPKTGPVRPEGAPVRKSTGGGRQGKKNLELDLESVKRHEIEAQRKIRYARREEKEEEKAGRKVEYRRWFGALGMVLLSSVLGFVILGGALGMLATPLRMGAGASLPLLALFWALFSQNAYPDLLHRRVIPWAKRSVSMLLLALLALILMIPETAGQSLREDGLWFVSMLPEGAQHPALIGVVDGICSVLGVLMGYAEEWLPWG